jgi:CDP-diglyceride synthetase
MRWIAKDSERKADPAPIKGTARKAVIFGMIGFALMFILATVFYNQNSSPHKIWYPYTALVGLVLGVFAFFKVGDR